jgi:hypothetical protein
MVCKNSAQNGTQAFEGAGVPHKKEVNISYSSSGWGTIF